MGRFAWAGQSRMALKLRVLWDDQLPARSRGTQPKVSTREGKAGRLTYSLTQTLPHVHDSVNNRHSPFGFGSSFLSSGLGFSAFDFSSSFGFSVLAFSCALGFSTSVFGCCSFGFSTSA